MAAASPFRLTVLNPSGRDVAQDFPDGAGESALPHPPTNFHAYAACTRGSFQRETKEALAQGTPVLVLLRGDFAASERALATLQQGGRFVAVSLKETGLHQIAEQLHHSTRLARFIRIVKKADGCLAPTPEAADLYRSLRGGGGAAFIPTPYPVDDPRWNFSRPIEQRAGIFIGTREWAVPSRNHLAALILARRLSETTGEPVTVFDYDGRRGARLLAELGFPVNKLRVLTRKLNYPDYLREMARHKIVLQLDTSFVPGQVAGDALLCRVPCVGGTGAIDRLAFPETSGFARSLEEIEKAALGLLTGVDSYRQSVTAMESIAAPRLAFKIVAEQLGKFFGQSD
ncbi:MAG TPA: hypothetical protein VM940_06375 [Chthoniobacterales bacterium]|jgi:hypothetical protein|nr:hypothetical protein [Chthoniobacterales bacterium]